MRYRFDRLELAGSLGDLGTFLPLAIGMILINGLSPLGLFLSAGVFYIISGLYYGITVPVQPMKVIGAYAIATGIGASQIFASSAIMGIFLLIIGGTGAISLIGPYIPKPVVRGVQLSTGVLLIAQGLKFILGTSKFQLFRQAAEPYLATQSLGPLSIGILIGILGGLLTFLLLENKKLPAGKSTIRFDFAYDGGGVAKGGTGTFYINDEKAGEGRIDRTQPRIFSADETADVGIDLATPVVEKIGSEKKSRFTGHIPKVTVEIKEEK